MPSLRQAASSALLAGVSALSIALIVVVGSAPAFSFAIPARIPASWIFSAASALRCWARSDCGTLSFRSALYWVVKMGRACLSTRPNSAGDAGALIAFSLTLEALQIAVARCRYCVGVVAAIATDDPISAAAATSTATRAYVMSRLGRVVVGTERLADPLGERLGRQRRFLTFAAQLLDGHVAGGEDARA